MRPPAPDELPGPLAWGVAAGLAAALASAASYLVARHHGNRGGGGSLRLLVLAHAVMGVASLPLVWWLAPAGWSLDRRWTLPLAGSILFYLAGQAAVFAALKRVAASRLAPLLGLKLVILATLATLPPGVGLDGRQWLAVGLSVLAAGMLQRGAAVPAAALGIVLIACLGFALSDLFIVALIDGLEATARPLTRLQAGGLGMAVSYALCGLAAAVAVAASPRLRPRDRRDVLAAVQYAAAWFGGAVALYACFGMVGAVFGNVLQSTRGVMAIVIGAALARAGWHDLEERVDRPTFLRRLAAAMLMVAAIGIFLSDPA